MPDINLLGPTTKQYQHTDALVASLVKGLAWLTVALCLFFGYLFYRVKATGHQITNERQTIDKEQQQILNSKDRRELLTRQSQLKDLDNLLQNHLYWSDLFPDLAKASLTNSSYVSFVATSEGLVTVTMNIANYVELDKFLQVFDLPDYNKNFSDVRIKSINKTQKDNSTDLEAKIQFRYNTSFLKKLANTPK